MNISYLCGKNNMENIHRIEEGDIFSLEDEIFNIRWKVKDLITLGWNIEDIINFRDDKLWRNTVIKILDK
jgi:hypothetical protein